MISHSYLIGCITLLFFITLITRGLPFMLGKTMADSKIFQFMGSQLPTCIIVLLAFYYMIDIAKPSQGKNLTWQVIALIVTLLIHWRWRLKALSLVAGTTIYLGLTYLFI